MRTIPAALGAAAVLVLLAACTAAEPEGAAGPTSSSRPAPTPVPSATTSPECQDGPGRTVTQLPDLVVDPVVVEDLVAPDAEVDGETVRGGVVPGFVLQGALVDGGCVVEHAAPGGCLGAVEITGAAIPSVTIPETLIPSVTLPGGEVADGRLLAAVDVEGDSAPTVRTEQVCQVESDGEVPTVSRAGIVREALSRKGAARPGSTRPERCVDGGCLPELVVPTVRLEPVRLDDVDVDPGRLERRTLEASRDVGVITGDDKTSYVAPGDLLFALDEATLGPDVEPLLQAIAEQVAATSGAVVVEGHTDAQGTDAYNDDLSTRRAQAVADWLTTRGGIDPARVEARGLGEGSPAYPDDEAGRPLNRRVVVTVLDG